MARTSIIGSALGLLSAACSAQEPPAPPEEPQPQVMRGFVPDDVSLERNLVYATVPAGRDEQPAIELKLDAAYLKRRTNEPMPVIVFIHGGGFNSGVKDEGLPFILAAARGGYYAVSIDYRLAGTARFPAAIHDCKAAVRHLRSHAAELGIDSERIGLWGHSAGGHLALLSALTQGVAEMEGEIGERGVSSSVTCAVSVSGTTDLSLLPDGGRRVRRWLGGSGEIFRQRLAAASPINHIDVDDAPVLLVHGVADRVTPIEHAERLAEAMTGAGAPAELYRVDEQGHILNDPAAFRRIGAFLDHHLGGHCEGTIEEALAMNAGQRPSPPAAPGDDED